ncbi:MAG: adenylate/guanylate cyclase domain-containing protein [Chloroflexota bacterium]|nr:adenylate/guanylate cyclase domain-containing protein [Chloroflexota bacterium]
MDLDRFNRLLLESAGVGLALADPETLGIAFANPRFQEWFPALEGPESRLDEVLIGLDVERMRSRLAADRPYRVDLELKANRRALTISVDVKRHVGDGGDLLVVECQNITKLKELEYMVESYSKMVERQNRDLRKEKDRVEKLLLNIMPRTIYEEWKEFGVTAPQRFDRAAVLMLDFVSSTEMDIAADPPALVAELNDIFTSFDRIVEQFGGDRLKTIGDAYMAVCGVPEPGSDDPRNIARIALRIVRYLQRRNAAQAIQWVCRIGINAGPVVGSIIGVQKYVYDIFGPGVGLAARMEALSNPMEITMAEDLYELIRDDVTVRERGEMDVKGFGTKRIYTLEGMSDLAISAHQDW